MSVTNVAPMQDGHDRVDVVDWQQWLDLGNASANQKHKRERVASPEPHADASWRRSWPLPSPSSPLAAPDNAVLANEGRVLPLQRPRSNSLAISSIDSLDQKAQLPDIRNVTVTPSPFADVPIYARNEPQIATLIGERVLEEPDAETGRPRAPSRASIQSLERLYKSKRHRLGTKRGKFAQILFRYSMYLLLLCIVYFVLVGIPLWKGAVWYLW